MVSFVNRRISPENKDSAPLWQMSQVSLVLPLLTLVKPSFVAKVSASPGSHRQQVSLLAVGNHFAEAEHQGSLSFALMPSLWASQLTCCPLFSPGL